MVRRDAGLDAADGNSDASRRDALVEQLYAGAIGAERRYRLPSGHDEALLDESSLVS